MTMQPDDQINKANVQYRGCEIRTASFEGAPGRWSPEACLVVKTEDGPRRLWVSSFMHCFGAENLTLGSQPAADKWALEAAEAIIDRAREKLELNSQGLPEPEVGYFSRMLSLTRQSFLDLRRSKD
jgi:hypothetical protein